MRKLLVGLFFLSGTAWATYIPVNGSTVTIMNPSGGTLAISGSLSANQSVNVAQINAATPLMGAGNTGTGSPRVTVATDNAAIATWGQGATGSAVPSGAQYHGGIAVTTWPSAASNGNLVGQSVDKMGRRINVLDCPYDLQISTTVTLTASTSETVLLSSGTAGVFNDLLAAVVTNSGSTASLVTFRETGPGLSSTGWIHIFAPATDTRGLTTAHVWPQQASASAWTVQSSASTSSIYVDAIFCQRK